MRLVYVIVIHRSLVTRFVRDLEDCRALCRIPNAARVLLSPAVF